MVKGIKNAAKGKYSKPVYKDRAPFNVNVDIENSFKENYMKALRNIFVNLSHKVIEFNNSNTKQKN